MCCCVPLYKLTIGGAIINIIVGLLFLYTCFPVLWMGFTFATTEGYQVLVASLLYTFYLIWFLPLGSLILWATFRRARRFLKWLAITLLLIQLYGSIIQIYYSVYVTKMVWSGTPLRYQRKVSAVREIVIQTFIAGTYLGTLFFFHRELDGETDCRNMQTNNPAPLKPYQTGLLVYQMDSMGENHQQQLIRQNQQPQYPGLQYPSYHFQPLTHQQQHQQQQQMQQMQQQQVNRPLNNMNMNYPQQI